MWRYFYPRSPCGERQTTSLTAVLTLSFLSTLSLRRATILCHHASALYPISIHALLAESDTQGVFNLFANPDFYPRSPCGERQPGERHANSQQEFLSTLSLRRATDVVPLKPTLLRFLSTLSLRRATCRKLLKRKINHHFYPRSPCGERLTSGQNDNDSNNISIHALLAESDASFFSGRSCFSDFHPRSPCGERRSHYSSSRPLKGFLSTLSLRRATKDTTARQQIADISIHALLAESDDTRDWTRGLCLYFYPRSPCGERRIATKYSSGGFSISIHALLAESDCSEKSSIAAVLAISIHALLAESD